MMGIVIDTMASDKRARQKANKAAADAEIVKAAAKKKQTRFVVRIAIVVIFIIGMLYFNQPDPVETNADLPITTVAP